MKIFSWTFHFDILGLQKAIPFALYAQIYANVQSDAS